MSTSGVNRDGKGGGGHASNGVSFYLVSTIALSVLLHLHGLEVVSAEAAIYTLSRPSSTEVHPNGACLPRHTLRREGERQHGVLPHHVVGTGRPRCIHSGRPSTPGIPGSYGGEGNAAAGAWAVMVAQLTIVMSLNILTSKVYYYKACNLCIRLFAPTPPQQGTSTFIGLAPTHPHASPRIPALLTPPPLINQRAPQLHSFTGPTHHCARPRSPLTHPGPSGQPQTPPESAARAPAPRPPLPPRARSRPCSPCCSPRRGSRTG